MASTNPAFMNGVPELLVLRLLRSREMYGYEIVQAIREETGEVVNLAEGVIYPLLHALERGGALTSRRTAVNGRSRIYYALSPRGVSRLDELTGLWSRLTQALHQVIKGEGYVPGV
ncbi:PadR family transcriptional regulator [Phenylobacterium sp.]|uniref:PadR family transcriptional regulator n=1 Tax=Phenylobacterium sp. TaxID=1871053 RepID=UPI0025E7BE52|nr:PadR family transcriptional regulator [Phenylobacterium sp.]